MDLQIFLKTPEVGELHLLFFTSHCQGQLLAPVVPLKALEKGIPFSRHLTAICWQEDAILSTSSHHAQEENGALIDMRSGSSTQLH